VVDRRLGARTAADPPYLAEKLALGVHAAALRGWSEGDVQDVHDGCWN
jgi:hypothetical protein